MKYRRATRQEQITSIINRGLYGMGVMVVVLSITQGITGLIGVLLLLLLTSGAIGFVLWIARTIEGMFNSRRGIE